MTTSLCLIRISDYVLYEGTWMAQILEHTLTNWLLIMHGCIYMASSSPLTPSTVRGPPHLLSRYLQLELSRHVLLNNARLCLRAQSPES